MPTSTFRLTEAVSDDEARRTVQRIADGLRAQQPAVLVTAPEVIGPFDAAPGDWRYLRVKFRIWPGRLDPDYADWMLTVTYRVTN